MKKLNYYINKFGGFVFSLAQDEMPFIKNYKPKFKIGDDVIVGKRTIRTILNIDISRIGTDEDYIYEAGRGSWCKEKHLIKATKKNINEINKKKLKRIKLLKLDTPMKLYEN